MKISKLMTRNVRTLEPERSIREAATLMADIDSGALLINEGDRLIGMITDRDIAVRAVAAGLDGNTPVRQVVRRLPVLNREKRLVGVVSLGNIASGHSRMANDTVLRGVTSAH